MSKLASMPFLVDAYIADTTHLSLEEHGAYILLLFAMWRREGYLPDIDADNARLLGVPVKHWLKLKERLAPFLVVGNGRLTQKRLQHQWNWAIEQRNRQAMKGSKGGRVNAERQRLKQTMFHANPSTATSPASSTATSTASDTTTSTRGSPEVASKKEKNIPTTYQEGDAGEDFTGVHRLLKTPAMRKTG